MKKFNLWWLVLVTIFCIFLFKSSFTTFFTNDDFYFLNISKASSVKEFVEFFNPIEPHRGQPMYRPLTTQAFYLLGRSIFNLNPLPMHILSFLCFLILVYLIYIFSYKISKDNKASIISAVLYATSATHFGHFYYLATFQEIGAAIFIFLSSILYLEFLSKNKKTYYLFSIATFLLAIFSKETAIILPFMLIIVTALYRKSKVFNLVPYFLILGSYLFIRINYYGLATGDSYVWDFSTKIFNTISWYALWSFNIPESFIDFVGPGLKLNPNLFKYWGNEALIIFTTLITLLSTLSILFLIRINKILTQDSKTYFFSVLIFILGILPVVFLPIHKFSFYLTISLFGITFGISNLLKNYKDWITYLVIFLWISGSFAAITYAQNTNWITGGALISKKVSDYFNSHDMTGKKYVYFYDEVKDGDLPWSPTAVVLNAISRDNFFEVYYPDRLKIIEVNDHSFHDNVIEVRSRQFLGY